VKIDATVPILYDPDNPGDSRIAHDTVRDPRSSLAGITPFLLGALLTCGYFGVAYPRLKGRRR
jgi:hypothetical protein